MGYLYFEDEELGNLFAAINNLQMIFHPTYAPEGQFTFEGTIDLQRAEDIIIIADKNLVSPICEISRTGTLNDKYRLQKVALFVTWTKYINARLTCGIGLLENDTSGLSSVTGEDQRLQFLHAVDDIPDIIWKDIGYGYRDSIPTQFVYRDESCNREKPDYRFDDHLLLLCNEVAMVKIVQLMRTPDLLPIDKFISFMNWYTDNLDIAESIVLYAAMVFAGTPHVAPPKKARSDSYAQVAKGIKNQAWDITYITAWSMLYRNEGNGSVNMFATDDVTQKLIIVNLLPPGQCSNAIESIFPTNSQGKKLKHLYDTKLGDARIRPFRNLSTEEQVATVKSLLGTEYQALRAMCCVGE